MSARPLRAFWNADPAFRWVVLVAACVVFGVLQGAGGAFTASFDGKSDEASHFMNAVVMRDYVLQWPPLPAPRDWLEQYYLHYPRIAPGQWPPLFHMLEAGWFLIVPPSRVSAMIFVGLLSVASIAAFYALLRRFAPLPWALATTALLVAAPEFQIAATTNMVEQLSLLLGILFLHATATFVESSASRGGVSLAVYGVLSVLAKGIGVTLSLAPFLAVLFSGQWRNMRLRKTILAVTGLAVVGIASIGFYAIANRDLNQILRWAGFTTQWWRYWNLKPVLNIAGTGITLLAFAGCFLPGHRIFRSSASALLVSTMAVAFFVRGLQENRHFILLLPVFLILSLIVLLRVSEVSNRNIRVAAIAAVIVMLVATFPRNLQRSVRIGQAAERIRLPARILVSAANGIREGAWIPQIRILQNTSNYGGTLVVRSTKTLASESFNGDRYRLLVTNAAEVDAFLNRHGIDTVILDDTPRQDPASMPGVLEPPPHHALVREAVQFATKTWVECGAEPRITIYCRATPLASYEPIQIRFSGLGRTVVERPPALLPAQK